MLVDRRRTSKKPVVGAIVLSLFSGVAGRDVCAQPSADKTATASDMILLVKLTHIDADDARDAVNSMNLGVKAVCASPDTLLLKGAKAAIERIVNQVIVPIDVPATAAGSRVVTTFMPLDFKPTRNLPNLLRAVVASKSSHVAMDSLSGMVVVNGTESEVAAVKGLLAQMDLPRESLTIQFFFLRADIGSGDPPWSKALPEALRPIAEVLAKNGFGNFSLIAPITVAVDQGRSFQQESSLDLGADGGPEDHLSLEVSGSARWHADGQTAQIEVSAAMQGVYVRPQHDEKRTAFEVDTTIVTGMGQYVILAASPASTSSGSAAALVVRVTRQGSE